MSLINYPYKDSIAEVFECFKSTETIIKQFEKEHGELSIPSINELRYVGYHFAEAAQGESEETIRLNIAKALNHCRRAKFDTYEASSTLVLGRLKNFAETYSKVTETLTFIPNYVEDLLKIQETSDALQEMVSTSRYETRELYYKDVEIHHTHLKKILQKFEIAKPQIERSVQGNNAKKITDARRFALGISATVLSILIITSINLGYWENNKIGTKTEPKNEYKESTESSKLSVSTPVIKIK